MLDDFPPRVPNTCTTDSQLLLVDVDQGLAFWIRRKTLPSAVHQCPLSVISFGCSSRALVAGKDGSSVRKMPWISFQSMHICVILGVGFFKNCCHATVST